MILGLIKGMFGRAPTTQKQLRLRAIWWSGFSNGGGVILENIWQNSFILIFTWEEPVGATFSWLHLLCGSGKRLHVRLHFWSTYNLDRLAGFLLKSVLESLFESCLSKGGLIVTKFAGQTDGDVINWSVWLFGGTADCDLSSFISWRTFLVRRRSTSWHRGFFLLWLAFRQIK